MGDLQSSREDATTVVRRLREAGHIAYFAGGCVRDELMGLTPKDYDVATDARPEKVRSLFRSTQAVGAAFGVILVRLNGSQIEVATFRSDGKYEDGRRPTDVVFTTAEEDAQRRDFTINGMFLDPLTNEVIDYVGGRDDLAAKRLRAIGNAADRFAEDHLRILRAVRFAARFGLTIAPDTAVAIEANVEALKRISPERIADELRRMLMPDTRGETYRLLQHYRIVDLVLRFLPDRQRRSPEPFSLFLSLGSDEPVSFGLALAAISLCHRMHATGRHDPVEFTTPDEVRRTCGALRQALKISNDEERDVASALSFGPLLADGANYSGANLKRFLARAGSNDARRLMAALATCGVKKDRIDLLEAQLTALAKTDVAPPPFVTGDDLTLMGMRPGPVFKKILDEVYDAQLENRVTTKAQAVELAKRLGGWPN